MSPLAISLMAFGCIFSGMLIGMCLRAVLPEHHLSEESKDAVKLGIGMIATLAALVLGLLIASAKDSFEITTVRNNR
jgi:cytochrome bd-type quinol oxidase subunit 2